jgi:hypothetical protein
VCLLSSCNSVSVLALNVSGLLLCGEPTPAKNSSEGIFKNTESHTGGLRERISGTAHALYLTCHCRTDYVERSTRQGKRPRQLSELCLKHEYSPLDSLKVRTRPVPQTAVAVRPVRPEVGRSQHLRGLPPRAMRSNPRPPQQNGLQWPASVTVLEEEPRQARDRTASIPHHDLRSRYGRRRTPTSDAPLSKPLLVQSD